MLHYLTKTLFRGYIKSMDNASQPSDNTSSLQTDSNGDQFITVGKYKVKVIKNTCIAAASCIAISPQTFFLNEAQKAEIIAGSTDTPENILMAAQSCPTKAIVIEDAETGKQVWPEG